MYCFRFFISGVGICLGLSGPGEMWAPSAYGDELVAANGTVLPAPPIETLDCEQVQDLLLRYSASGYRDAGKIPTEQPDRGLVEYEDALAKHHYESCHLGANDYWSPSDVFGKGFN